MADGDRTLQVSIQSSMVGSADIERDYGGNQEGPFHCHLMDDLTTGTGDDQADRVFSDKRSVSSGSPDDLDMRDGSLEARDGKSFVIAELKGLQIKNLSASATLLIGGAVSNPYDQDPFVDGTTILEISPMGHMNLSFPKDGNNPVTATTKVLRINSSSASSSNYEIAIIGVSA